MPDRPNFPIPDVIDPPRTCLCIEIPDTDQHKQIIAGLLWELTQWFNWQRDPPTNSGKALAQVYREVFNSIDWSDMSCCCNQTIPVLTRIDPTNQYNVQISYDNGATWVDDPNQPRFTITVLTPPVTSGVSATKCDAASNALQHIKDTVAKESDDMASGATIIDLALLITAYLVGLWIAPEVTIPTITPILLAAISAIFALGHDDFVAYWTSDVYDKILCAMYCNIQEDGSFTDAGSAAAVAKMQSDMPASPAKDWLLGILKVGGTKGLNNFAAYGSSADSDCSSCDPCENPCDYSAWNVWIAGGTLDTRSETHITVIATDGGDGHWYASVTSGNKDTCCCVDVNYTGTPPGTQGYIPCGTVIDPGNLNFAFSGHPSANTIAFKGDASYSVIVTAVDCP
jgi:hypothetical protein